MGEWMDVGFWAGETFQEWEWIFALGVVWSAHGDGFDLKIVLVGEVVNGVEEVSRDFLAGDSGEQELGPGWEVLVCIHIVVVQQWFRVDRWTVRDQFAGDTIFAWEFVRGHASVPYLRKPLRTSANTLRPRFAGWTRQHQVRVWLPHYILEMAE